MTTVSPNDASGAGVQPFSVAVDTAVIDELRARIRRARLPEAAPGEPWAQGTDRDWLEGLLRYWADAFDWPAAERELNRFAHYRARIGDAVVHFVHERARHGGGIPLILGHGWPSCFAELLPLVPLLTDPAGHGIERPGVRRRYPLPARLRVLDPASRPGRGHLSLRRRAVAHADARPGLCPVRRGRR